MIWMSSAQISKLAPHDIDVRGGSPSRAGVGSVRIAKGDVNAGNFFVLQDVADNVVEAEISADGELSHAVAVFVACECSPRTPFPVLC